MGHRARRLRAARKHWLTRNVRLGAGWGPQSQLPTRPAAGFLASLQPQVKDAATGAVARLLAETDDATVAQASFAHLEVRSLAAPSFFFCGAQGGCDVCWIHRASWRARLRCGPRTSTSSGCKSMCVACAARARCGGCASCWTTCAARRSTAASPRDGRTKWRGLTGLATNAGRGRRGTDSQPLATGIP